MKFSIFGVDIAVSKKRNTLSLPTIEDIRSFNNETLQYIKGLSAEERKKRVDDLCFPYLSEQIGEAKHCLNKNGIVVAPKFLSEDVMPCISSELALIRARVSEFEASNDKLLEEDNVIFQKGFEKASSYQALSTFNKTIVHIRQGQDLGMVDIFNVDIWRPLLGKVLRPRFQQETVLKLMANGMETPDAKNLNLYLNKSIELTRGFHVDSYGKKQLKGFIYLEDCLELEKGPYTYVKESHLQTPLTKINKYISSVFPQKTETPFVALEKITPVLANKGALIISDQSGSHRGFPQSKGYQRAVAVMNFQ